MKYIRLSIPYRILTWTQGSIKEILWYLSIPYRILTQAICLLLSLSLTFNSLPDSHIEEALNQAKKKPEPFNSLPDSHDNDRTTNMVQGWSFNSLPDSHGTKTSEYRLYHIHFQFPTGFSPKKRIPKTVALMMVFQFPTGFSHIYDQAYTQQATHFQFPTGFSQKYVLFDGSVWNKPFNSLPDSHINLWRLRYFQNHFFQFPTGFSRYPPPTLGIALYPLSIPYRILTL